MLAIRCESFYCECVRGRIEADYLVVGAGTAGMVFTDRILAHSDATVAIVDRRHAPGGHWQDAYPFVRLHQPANLYGVESVPFGADRRDVSGTNAGMYELAGPSEICAHFEEAMTRVFLPTGRVVYLPECEFVDEGRIVSRLDGRTVPVTVRRRVVDARYLEGRIPATSAPPFAVAEGVRCIPTGGLARLAHPAGHFTVIGAGKTALDTCVWLLERGVDPADLTWIKPREGWWPNRRYLQPHDLVVDQYVANAAQIEAMAQATTIDDLFARLDEQGILLRVDPSVPPTMFHGAIVGEAEIALLRRIEDVVRLGHVRTVERDRIILDDGIIPTTGDTLHLHCAAAGLVRPPLRPIFEPGRITLQPMFWGTVSFQYAMLGVVEAELHDDDQKNELCRPVHLWDRNVDFLIAYAALMANARARGQHPAVSAWSRTSRLYPFAELERYADDPRLPEARERSRAHAAGALSNLPRLIASA